MNNRRDFHRHVMVVLNDNRHDLLRSLREKVGHYENRRVLPCVLGGRHASLSSSANYRHLLDGSNVLFAFYLRQCRVT